MVETCLTQRVWWSTCQGDKCLNPANLPRGDAGESGMTVCVISCMIGCRSSRWTPTRTWGRPTRGSRQGPLTWPNPDVAMRVPDEEDAQWLRPIVWLHSRGGPGDVKIPWENQLLSWIQNLISAQQPSASIEIYRAPNCSTAKFLLYPWSRNDIQKTISRRFYMIEYYEITIYFNWNLNPWTAIIYFHR